MPTVLANEDIRKLAHVGRNKARDMIKTVNAYAEQNGYDIFDRSKCITQHFCDVYGFRIADIEKELGK